MSDIQYKSSYREKYNRCDIGGIDVPHGLYDEVDKAHKKWLIRRGFAKEEQIFQYGNPEKRLRGAAAISANRVANSKKVQSSGNKSSGLTPGKIIGKFYSTRDSAMRAIRNTVAANAGLTRDQFDVHKVDCGNYKVIQKKS